MGRKKPLEQRGTRAVERMNVVAAPTPESARLAAARKAARKKDLQDRAAGKGIPRG